MAELVYSAPRATLLGNIITVSTLLLVFGSMLFSPFIIVATCYLIYCYPVVSVTITALLVGSLWAPLRPWKAFGHNFIFAHWRSYFSFQLKVSSRGPRMPRTMEFLTRWLPSRKRRPFRKRARSLPSSRTASSRWVCC